MTPALDALTAAGVDFTVIDYDHDPASASYGAEAAAKSGADPASVFKTLIVAFEDRAARSRYAVAVLPVGANLALKLVASALAVKKVALAQPAAAERVTGYVLGGISPFGQRQRLPTMLDATATGFETIYVSGGRRGLELGVAPMELARLLDATVTDLTGS